MKSSLIDVLGVKKYFHSEGSIVKAVDGITFSIHAGKTIGVVGESGCGKSTLGRTILLLYTPTEGKILFKGKNIVNLNKKQLRKLRRKMQIVFQDPFSSLNPRWTVEKIIGSPLSIHKIAKGKELRNRVYELLNQVGLKKEHSDRFSHEFSGGQAQRICIARALALNPDFIVADEPLSALDVSVQAQIINLFQKLQNNFKLTYLFISHDMAVIKYISQYILVMYLGKVVERADSYDLFTSPFHPYTEALLSAIPTLSKERGFERGKIKFQGEIPSQVDLSPGCRFYGRCCYRRKICQQVEPEDIEIRNNHVVKCHLYTNF